MTATRPKRTDRGRAAASISVDEQSEPVVAIDEPIEHTFGGVPVEEVVTADLQVLRADSDRKARGAFFTPPAIATFLARWAIAGRPDAKILDPTSGEGIFLLAAGQQLRDLGAPVGVLNEQVYGVDLHEPSLRQTMRLLEAEGLDASLVEADFFDVPPPQQELFATLPLFDAVIGNPPFVRYQQHIGAARKLSAKAAMSQGVRLSGLASSWAALLVHAGAFLKPDGRIAMVIPAELLTVGYAEPVRQWLRRRFAAVKLVLFDRLQFANVLEDVVLVLAHGTGGCDAFSVYYVDDAEDLYQVQPFDEFAMTLSEEGKWTDLLLSNEQRRLFRQVTADQFVGLGSYGAPELGTVTGANAFFTLTEPTRDEYGLVAGKDVRRICPPGTRYLRGLTMTSFEWRRLRDAGEAVWILFPEGNEPSDNVRRYLQVGEEAGVPEAYKCRVRTPWWRPPLVSPPDPVLHLHEPPVPAPGDQRGKNLVRQLHAWSAAPRGRSARSEELALVAYTELRDDVGSGSLRPFLRRWHPEDGAA